jgi:hypothetical protein
MVETSAAKLTPSSAPRAGADRAPPGDGGAAAHAAPGRHGPAQAIVTPEGRAEIEAAREQIAATRRELRAVQLELRRDIEALEMRLRLLNIVAVPLVLTVLAIVIAVMRTRRRAAARA